MTNIDQSAENVKAKPHDDREAETYNYKPAKRSKLAYLVSVAEYGLGIGDPVTIKGDDAIALHRISKGRGGPVPVHQVQQDEHGKGFMAQLCARLHALRHRYGFCIANRTERHPEGNKSWYWLELDGAGRPKMKAVPVEDGKTGKPAASPKPTKVTFVPSGANVQASMFGSPEPIGQMPLTPSFAQSLGYETGRSK